MPAEDWSRKSDGQWLAELLGIDERVLARVHHADATDQREARAMNLALWPAVLLLLPGVLRVPNPRQHPRPAVS